MVRHSIHRVAALFTGLSLACAVVLPLHAHTCLWPSAVRITPAVEPLPPETEVGHEGACLACTIDRRLQAPTTGAPATLHALSSAAGSTFAPLAERPRSRARHPTHPRGPPLSS